eukprot:g4078.t1
MRRKPWLEVKSCRGTPAAFSICSWKVRRFHEAIEDGLQLSLELIRVMITSCRRVMERVRSEILPSIGVEESSICQVGVLSEEDFVSAQATNGGSFCNLQRIGPAVGSHMVGLSVSDGFVDPYVHRER